MNHFTKKRKTEMDYIYYKLPDGNVWNYWGVERSLLTAEGIAVKLAEKLGFNSDFKVKVSGINVNGEPVSFSIGQVQIKRVSPCELSRFNGYFDEQISNGDETEKDSYFQSYLDGKLGF